MKKIVCVILCLGLLMGLAIPALAEEMQVYFTDDSCFEVGGTVRVDIHKIMYDPNCTAEVYNALLEGDVQYYWFRGGEYYADGSSITLRDGDQGYEFYCQAAAYEDADHTQQCGTLYSASFTVPPLELPEITTKSLSSGTVGEPYYQKLECTNPDVTFGLLQSSLPDGLNLTQHGEIEGTPTKAGFFYVVILIQDEFGVENTAEFEMTIKEKPPVQTEAPTAASTEAPTQAPTEVTTEATTPETTEATQAATGETVEETTEEPVLTVGAADDGAPGENNSDNGWVLWLCVGVLAVLLAVGAAVCVILLVATKKKI